MKVECIEPIEVEVEPANDDGLEVRWVYDYRDKYDRVISAEVGVRWTTGGPLVEYVECFTDDGKIVDAVSWDVKDAIAAKAVEQ